MVFKGFSPIWILLHFVDVHKFVEVGINYQWMEVIGWMLIYFYFNEKLK